MQPTTDEAYLIACKKLNIKPESESLPDGTSMHWLGPKTASKLIVNFHGGGYVLTASPDQYEFLSGLQQLLSKQGKDVAVIFLSYGTYHKFCILLNLRLTYLRRRFGTESKISATVRAGHGVCRLHRQ